MFFNLVRTWTETTGDDLKLAQTPEDRCTALAVPVQESDGGRVKAPPDQIIRSLCGKGVEDLLRPSDPGGILRMLMIKLAARRRGWVERWLRNAPGHA